MDSKFRINDLSKGELPLLSSVLVLLEKCMYVYASETMEVETS